MALPSLYEPLAPEPAEHVIGYGVTHLDPVECRHGGEAVGDDDARAAPHEVLEGALDERLGLAVEGGGRLVEHEGRAVGQDGPRDRDALALAA